MIRPIIISLFKDDFRESRCVRDGKERHFLNTLEQH